MVSSANAGNTDIIDEAQAERTDNNPVNSLVEFHICFHSADLYYIFKKLYDFLINQNKTDYKYIILIKRIIIKKICSLK